MLCSTSIPSGRSREVQGAPDVIWLNGAFGVGKTSVAELIVEQIDGATLVDPELVGGLFRLLVPSDGQAEDFQDMSLWRSLTREAIGSLVSAGRGPLVIPMTLVRLDYFDEIVGALRRNDVDLRHFTLLASAETCVASLADPRFAEHVDADTRDATSVAAAIVGCLAA